MPEGHADYECTPEEGDDEEVTFADKDPGD